ISTPGTRSLGCQHGWVTEPSEVVAETERVVIRPWHRDEADRLFDLLRREGGGAVIRRSGGLGRAQAATRRRRRGRDRLALAPRQLGQRTRQRSGRRSAGTRPRRWPAGDLGRDLPEQPSVDRGLPTDRDVPPWRHPPLVSRAELDVLGRRAIRSTAVADTRWARP